MHICVRIPNSRHALSTLAHRDSPGSRERADEGHGQFEEQLRRRDKVVESLHELLTTPQIQSGAIQHTLKPGWMWTYAYTDLIEEGKRLRQAIDSTLFEAPATEQPPF